MTVPDSVARGVSMALDAHRRRLITTDGLNLILKYYDQEGAVAPAPPEEVLHKLGGFDCSTFAVDVEAPAEQGRPFTARLTLLETLGRGGMGTVYKAFDRVLNRTVALKVVHADLPAARRQVFLARFERE